MAVHYDFQSFLGQSSTPVRNEIEKGAIRRFSEALGDENPLYYDEEFAKSTRHGGIVAPPTFSRTFDYGDIPGFTLPFNGLIHGEQSFTYYKPILAGTSVWCSQTLSAVKETKGKLGLMVMLKFTNEVRGESGDLLLTDTLTAIYRPKEES